jgi:hypothetical protein
LKQVQSATRLDNIPFLYSFVSGRNPAFLNTPRLDQDQDNSLLLINRIMSQHSPQQPQAT